MQIIPSLFDKDTETFAKHITSLQGVVEMVQIDIADGNFVPSHTWNDPVWAAETLGAMEAELHLMVVHPLTEIERWKSVSQIRRVLFHIESADTPRETIAAVRACGWQAGIVLNPQTPAELVFPFLSLVDEVMLMSVNPGAQGQSFIPSVLSKIQEIKSRRPDIPVALDGGINLVTLPMIIEAGIDIICPGSAVVGNEKTPRENIEEMHRIIDKTK